MKKIIELYRSGEGDQGDRRSLWLLRGGRCGGCGNVLKKPAASSRVRSKPGRKPALDRSALEKLGEHVDPLKPQLNDAGGITPRMGEIKKQLGLDVSLFTIDRWR